MAGAGQGAEKEMKVNKNEAEDYGLFQVQLSEFDLNMNFIKTKAAVDEYQGNQALNCLNLTVVLLGIIEDPKEYLKICKERNRSTPLQELNNITKNAFQKIGVPYKGLESFTHVNEIKPMNPLLLSLQKLGKYLHNGHATPVGFQYDDGQGHMALLRKDKKGSLELIDPQLYAEDGTYPFRTPIVLFSKEYKPIPYAKSVVKVVGFQGPSMSGLSSAFAKSGLTSHLMREEKGGRRKTRGKRKYRATRRRRISG